MRFGEIITLIKRKQDIDEYGFEKPQDEAQDEARDIYADLESVKRQEFYAGLRAGRSITQVFVIRCADYEEEQLVRYGDKLYEVARAYTKDGEFVELNCTEVKRGAIAE